MTLTREQLELKNRFLVESIDIARERNLSKAQCDDIAIRAVQSGKVFLSTDTGELNTLAGYSAAEYVEMLAEDPSAAHLFQKSESAKPNEIYGIPADKFEKLTAMQRLELANKHSTPTRTRKGNT